MKKNIATSSSLSERKQKLLQEIKEEKKKIKRKKSKKFSPAKINYLIDFAVLLMFLLGMDPKATGIIIHEWLSVVFTIVIIIHLLLHWAWIIAVSKRFLKKLAGQARLNFVLNILLFIFTTIIIFTGIMASKIILPFLGIDIEKRVNWIFLHNLSSDITLLILGLHIALHWKWIVTLTKRYAKDLIPPPRSRRKKAKIKGNRI